MIDLVFRWIGIVACVAGALCVIPCLAWLVGEAWIAASRKWRTIFRAESSILDYIQHRKDFEKWQKEQEALKDGKGD